MNLLPKKLLVSFTVALMGILLVARYFDRALFFGIALVAVLTLITLGIFYVCGIRDKRLYGLFFLTLVIHAAAVLFFYYAKFQPFGEGDFIHYQQTAEQIAQRFGHGIFSWDGLWVPHGYPVLIGIIYTLTVPSMLVGQLFSAWLAALSVALVFLLIMEMSSSKEWPVAIGLIMAVYPSYLFFGGLLLKDTVIIPLVISGILVSLKMFKSFSWPKFMLFFAILTALIHLRFYVGFALMFSFIISWFLISNFTAKQRLGYGAIMVFLLGFSPWLLHYGYFGSIPLKGYLNEKTIVSYREVVYAPNPVAPPPAPAPPPVVAKPVLLPTATVVTPAPPPSPSPEPPKKNYCEDCPLKDQGVGSSFVVHTDFHNPIKFAYNYFVSFTYSLLGPFPWQIRHARQILALVETIPWYFLIGLFIYGLAKSFAAEGFLKTAKRYTVGIPLFLFALMSLGALSLFIANFGIIARIRMPSLIILLCLISLDQWSSGILKKVFHSYATTFTGFHRVSLVRKRSEQ